MTNKFSVKQKRSERSYYEYRLYCIFSKLETHNILRDINFAIRTYDKGYKIPSLVRDSEVDNFENLLLNNFILGYKYHYGYNRAKFIYLELLKYYEIYGSWTGAYNIMIIDSLRESMRKSRDEMLDLINNKCKEIEDVIQTIKNVNGI